jgi:hypothetical protein
MPMDLERLGVYRIVPIQNLEYILENGIYCKKECPIKEDYVNIGSNEVIHRRDEMIVKCFPDTVVMIMSHSIFHIGHRCYIIS